MSSRSTSYPPLRVALDTSYAGVNPTGVGLYSALLAAELRSRATDLGIDLQCDGPACDQPRVRNSLLGTFQEWPTYTHGILPLRLLAYRPQIVHATSHIGPLWGPGKLVVTVHDLIFMRYPEDYQRGWLLVTRALLPRVLRRATAIIADSNATKDDLHTFFGSRKSKIVVIYPGIDSTNSPKVPSSGTSPNQLTNNAQYILCLGPWVRRKNIELVMKAFSLLAAKLHDIHLVVTGDTPRGMKGYSAEELLSLVSADFRSRVHLVGYVYQSEKNALLAGASVLCYPSRFEGFGLPPLEAMSKGVPVVVASTPATVEVSGEAAIVAGPDDPAEWATEIEGILCEPGLAEHLREAGLHHSASFTWSRCARQTAELYHKVARSQRS